MGFEPNFNGVQAKALKEINKRLKQLTEDAGMVYDLQKCLATFNRFLTLAYSDNWLRNNFQLSILYGKFDIIIAKGKPKVGNATITGIQQAFNDFYNQQ